MVFFENGNAGVPLYFDLDRNEVLVIHAWHYFGNITHQRLGLNLPGAFAGGDIKRRVVITFIEFMES